MSDQPILILLRAAAFKGRASADQLGKVTGLDAMTLASMIADAQQQGLLQETRAALRVTKDGQAELKKLLAAERDQLDPAAVSLVTAAYERFTPVNTNAKGAFTAWQVLPDGAMNEHTDAGYDADVLRRLGAPVATVEQLLAEISISVPRAAHYRDRLQAAWKRAETGDHRYVTSPLTDSVHTVWFELHEELIGWAGLTRAAEASRGAAD